MTQATIEEANETVVPEVAEADTNLSPAEENLARLLGRERHATRLASKILLRLKKCKGRVLLGFLKWSEYVRERTGLSLRQVQDHMRVERALELEKNQLLNRLYDQGRMTFNDVLELTRRNKKQPPEEGLEEPLPQGPTAEVLLQLDGEAREGLHATREVSHRLHGGRQPDWQVLDDLSAECQTAFISAVDPERLEGLPEPVVIEREELDSGSAGECDTGKEPTKPIKLSYALVRDPVIRELRYAAAGGRGPNDMDSALRQAIEIQRKADYELGRELRSRPEITSQFRRRSIPPDVVAHRPNTSGMRPISRLVRRAPRLPNCQPISGRLLRSYRDSGAWQNLGHTRFKTWVEERLGMSSRKAMYLIALDRKLVDLPLTRAQYRAGRLSWLQVGLISRVALEGHERPWIKRAHQVTVNRLELDVKQVEMLKEEQPDRYNETAGEPPEAEYGDNAQETAPRLFEREMARRSKRLKWVRIEAPVDVVRGWILATTIVREVAGREITSSQMILAMCEAFNEQWDNEETRKQLDRRGGVLGRDGCQCANPLCRSMSNLHGHHIVFKSEGGGDEPSNIVTLCAQCHGHLVHPGRIKVTGKAPDKMTWKIGCQMYRDPIMVLDGDWKRGVIDVEILSEEEQVA